MAESIFGASPSCGDAQFGVASRGPRRFTITRSTRTWAFTPSFTSKKVSRHFVGGYDNMRLNTHTRETHTRGVRNRTPARERRKKNLLDLFALFAKCRMATLAESIAHLASCLPRDDLRHRPRRRPRPREVWRAPRSRAVGAAPGSRLPARLPHRVPRCHPARLRQRGLLVRGDRGDQLPPRRRPPPRPRPPRASPDRATPINPAFLAAGDFSAALLIAAHRARASPAKTSSPRAPPWRRRRSSSAGSAPLPRGRLRLGLAQRRVMGGRAPCDDHRRPDVVLRLGVRHPAQERGGLRDGRRARAGRERWRSRADWGSSARSERSSRRPNPASRSEREAKSVA